MSTIQTFAPYEHYVNSVRREKLSGWLRDHPVPPATDTCPKCHNPCLRRCAVREGEAQGTELSCMLCGTEMLVPACGPDGAPTSP